jgi:hypothetical protein
VKALKGSMQLFEKKLVIRNVKAATILYLAKA